MKILVIQMKMIGDVLTSSILFEALRKEFPDAELHYMIYKHTYPVVENNPFIDKFIFSEKGESLKRLIKATKKNKYYAVIDVYSNLRTALTTGLSGAEYRISYDKTYTKLLSTHVFSREIKAKTVGGAAIEKRLRLLSPLSSSFPNEIKPKIYLLDEEIEEAKNRLLKDGIDLSKRLYMISALGSSTAKTYPLPYLAEILDEIVKNTGANLLLNYIPSQRSIIEKLLEYCEPETRNRIHLEIYGNSIREFLALTYHCDGLIGNEGGAVNMAKAINIPTFAIFSPPLNKENWNMYEDGKKNISVHLKDYKPEIFQNKTFKELAKINDELYQILQPSLIIPKLQHFLNQHS
ncbi:glycosyltransferase family 9 protein [Christiangramia sp. SM2212]|uniref:Glycosyltransferase family 9 protein n=1 Tax=Christiangramia sediminicola TaxID=3073267 RepID=A0ABU1EQZ6_9FLAO|nr:glycosyltransferase family 9 protein [Christiangramia sp. SM2212]MDR5590817.1 glycosyltransferase family 9 protein [Christiangramia sp. SM2212]